MIIELTDDNFKEKTAEGLVLIDFWATWCGPCRMQAPVIDELAEEMSDQVTFGKLDVDENQQTAAQHRVMSIPTLIIKKDGQIVETLMGYTPKEKLASILKQHLDA